MDSVLDAAVLSVPPAGAAAGVAAAVAWWHGRPMAPVAVATFGNTAVVAGSFFALRLALAKAYPEPGRALSNTLLAGCVTGYLATGIQFRNGKRAATGAVVLGATSVAVHLALDALNEWRVARIVQTRAGQVSQPPPAIPDSPPAKKLSWWMRMFQLRPLEEAEYAKLLERQVQAAERELAQRQQSVRPTEAR